MVSAVDIAYVPRDIHFAHGLREALENLQFLVAMQLIRQERSSLFPAIPNAISGAYRPLHLRAYVLIASAESMNEMSDGLKSAIDDSRPVVLVYRPRHESEVRAHPVVTEIGDAAAHLRTDFSDLKETAAEIALVLGRPSNESVRKAEVLGPPSNKSAWKSNQSVRKVEGLGPPANKSASQAEPDVFISYVAEDAERAKVLAEAIETCGWQVWWDRTLVPGVNFRTEIERQLDAVRCVVVLWSKQSIKSDWVVDEATHAKQREVLVQVLLDGVAPPLGFRQQHFADLTKWNGEPEGAGFPVLKKGIARLIPSRSIDAIVDASSES